MAKTHDRRYLAALGFLGFLGFLAFLGSEKYQDLARFAALAYFSLPALLVLLPRKKSKVPPRYRLESLTAVMASLTEKTGNTAKHQTAAD